MRKAKIICTLGPAIDPPGVLEALVEAGMDVARLNFSHGTHDEHRRRFDRVRSVALRHGRAVAVLQDVQGPKIRLATFEGGELRVRDGQEVIVTTRHLVGRGNVIPTPVKSLPRDVRRGDPILLDDGRVRLEVRRVRGRDVFCRVAVGGLLKDHKGLNLPGSPMSMATITPKDAGDLALGQELGVDYVALSFVRRARDVELARLRVAKRKTPLIAKIEKPQAVDDLEAIARASDGVMIARGDLGVELPLERVPPIQKRALKLVNRMGGLTIVATEMLESMIQNPRPTRAEVSDVANAIQDGADAVMLSGETAIGKYPVEALRYMARVVEEAEVQLGPRIDPPFDHREEISIGVAAAAVAAAAQLEVSTIVAFTESGYTARLLSEFRPRARILGFTPNRESVQRMALYWGVEPRKVNPVETTDGVVRQVRHACLAEGARRGTPVVIVCGVPLRQPGTTNLMTVHRL